MAQPSRRFIVAVVERDEETRSSLEYLLKSAQCKVRVFASAAALLESGCLAEIDCLISEIDLPGAAASQALALIHAARPALPTVLITAFPNRVNSLPALDGIYPGLFTKPLRPAELLPALSDIRHRAN